MAGPTELQLALFSTLEDIYDLTGATVALLVDERGDTVAVSGDENDVPPDLRAVLGGRRLAEAGSVPALLEKVDASAFRLNVSLFPVGAMLLAILFDAEADLGTVQAVGREAAKSILALVAAAAAN